MKFSQSENCTPRFWFYLDFSDFSANKLFVLSIKANNGSKLSCIKGKVKTDVNGMWSSSIFKAFRELIAFSP